MKQNAETRLCPFSREACTATCMLHIVPNSSAGLPCALAESLRLSLVSKENAEPLLVRVLADRHF